MIGYFGGNPVFTREQSGDVPQKTTIQIIPWPQFGSLGFTVVKNRNFGLFTANPLEPTILPWLS
jgi:hypothetical protein